MTEKDQKDRLEPPKPLKQLTEAQKKEMRDEVVKEVLNQLDNFRGCEYSLTINMIITVLKHESVGFTEQESEYRRWLITQVDWELDEAYPDFDKAKERINKYIYL